jgi:hypothetical protein
MLDLILTCGNNFNLIDLDQDRSHKSPSYSTSKKYAATDRAITGVARVTHEHMKHHDRGDLRWLGYMARTWIPLPSPLCRGLAVAATWAMIPQPLAPALDSSRPHPDPATRAWIPQPAPPHPEARGSTSGSHGEEQGPMQVTRMQKEAPLALLEA